MSTISDAIFGYQTTQLAPCAGKEFATIGGSHTKKVKDMKVGECRKMASKLEIKGRSAMNKEQLVKAIKGKVYRMERKAAAAASSSKKDKK